MAVQVNILSDETIEVKWIGKKNRSSLYHVLARGNAKDVNQLDRNELLTIWACGKCCPYPFNNREKIFNEYLNIVKNSPNQLFDERIKNVSLGQLRKLIIELCGNSCNGPYDSYINFLIESKKHIGKHYGSS